METEQEQEDGGGDGDGGGGGEGGLGGSGDGGGGAGGEGGGDGDFVGGAAQRKAHQRGSGPTPHASAARLLLCVVQEGFPLLWQQHYTPRFAPCAHVHAHSRRS